MNTRALIAGIGDNIKQQKVRKPVYGQNKPMYEAAITGYVRSGATIVQIQRITGLSALDIEQVIIDKKLSVKP